MVTAKTMKSAQEASANVHPTVLEKCVAKMAAVASVAHATTVRHAPRKAPARARGETIRATTTVDQQLLRAATVTPLVKSMATVAVQQEAQTAPLAPVQPAAVANRTIRKTS